MNTTETPYSLKKNLVPLRRKKIMNLTVMIPGLLRMKLPPKEARMTMILSILEHISWLKLNCPHLPKYRSKE